MCIEVIEVSIIPTEIVTVEILSEIVHVGEYEHYKGDYSVIPKFEEQILKTKNLAMDFDVTVASIPIEQVSNLSGGKTIIIGG